MKKCSLYELLALVMVVSFGFFTGCSSDKIAGTSEEGNEFAYRESSSSEETSSNSNDPEVVLSSSSEKSSSSSKDVSKNSSSSCERLNNSSSDSNLPAEISSSSEDDGRMPDIPKSSSSRGAINEGTARPNTLDYYLDLYNLESDAFDNGVLSTKFDYSQSAHSENPNTPPMATEFDSPWPHKIVKQNVDMLNEYFPTAVKIHSKIITAIKNETLDENCGLYSFNVYGDDLSAAFIIAEISKDTIKVLDVPADKCEAILGNEMSRFLFYYCGELDSHPDVVHIPVETSLKNCPVYEKGREWVKSN